MPLSVVIITPPPFLTQLWKLHVGWVTNLSNLQRQFQSVLNAEARPVFRLRRYDHITDALAVLHWLRVPQRVDYKVAVTAFRALSALSPQYLDQLVRVADLPGCHRLRSSSSHRLQVPEYRLATVGGRSFPAAASIPWNSLPPDIQLSAP